MRASTLFAIIVSLLIGLSAAAGAKYLGLFDSKPVKEEPVVTTPPPAPVEVLVAAQPIYTEAVISSAQVRVRALRPDERTYYDANKKNLLPAFREAAVFRQPKRPITVDTIITSDMLEEQALPKPPREALPIDHRLVNVAVSKQQSAGGVLRVGEIVDVILTSRVSVAGKGDELKTVTIAKNCKIAMKRDNIWSILRSDPDNKPIEFTLQANTYRAALIEFCKFKGQITLQPAPGIGMMQVAMEDADKVTAMNSREGYSIGDEDLVRIFNIRPVPPGTPPDVTLVYKGSGPVQRNVFQSKDAPPPPAQWFNVGPVGSVSGVKAAQLPPGSLMYNEKTGMYYDPNNKSDPNNPGCTTCGKKPVPPTN